MSTNEQFLQYIESTFKSDVDTVHQALKDSPNARGYTGGAVTEHLLRKHLSDLGYIVERIKEKWEGDKLNNHRGDFYFQKEDGPCYVLESKGIKSNAEKWHKLYNYDSLIDFLLKYRQLIKWLDSAVDEGVVKKQIKEWVEKNLGKFLTEYRLPLCPYDEVEDFLTNNPQEKQTLKYQACQMLKDSSRNQIDDMIAERLEYIREKVRVLETHLVAGKSKKSERKMATPRKTEFNVLSVDIYLRHDMHCFYFVNPQDLPSARKHSNHLQQNYVMGFVFPEEKDILHVPKPWTTELDTVVASLKPEFAVKETDKQPDTRNRSLDDE